MLRFRSLAPALAGLLLTPTLPAGPSGQVWTVAPSGADFTQIQPAVDAAGDGDLVLVKPGSYGQFAIFDRSLTVVAELPGSVHIDGVVRVSGLSEQRRVALIDLSATGNEQYALAITDNQGSVRVRGGTWIGTDYAQPWWGMVRSAVRVAASADVSLSSVTLRGGHGVDAVKSPIGGPSSGGSGLEVHESSVSVHHSTLTGGNGGGDYVEEGYGGGQGGSGVRVEGGFVYLVSCTLRGGNGGPGGDESGCVPFGIYAGDGGKGGDGVTLWGGFQGYGPAHAELIAMLAVPGKGAAGGWGYCGPNGNPGPDGQLIGLVGQASTNTLPGPLRRFSADGLWRPGVPETLSFKGLPDEDVFLVLSPQAGFSWQAAKQGVLLLGGLPVLKYAGRLDASGALTRSFVPPPLPPGWEGRTLLRQAWMTKPGSASALTGPVTSALIDPAF